MNSLKERLIEAAKRGLSWIPPSVKGKVPDDREYVLAVLRDVEDPVSETLREAQRKAKCYGYELGMALGRIEQLEKFIREMPRSKDHPVFSMASDEERAKILRGEV